MEITSAADALRRRRANAGRHYPDATDARLVDGLLLPALAPRFTVPEGGRTSVFTIGSCFARNIEEWLDGRGIAVPTRAFAVPPHEWTGRPNGPLNEFNPGTIAQRIGAALGAHAPDERTLEERAGGWADLLIPGGGLVARERALARRGEIAAVYAHLASADLVVITLGLAEAWFDTHTGLYLNQIPDPAGLRAGGERYQLRELDTADCVALLEPALAALVAAGIVRIVLSVSPVPLRSTFSGVDAMVASCRAKSVLRAAADELLRRVPQADYFPSYEIVTTAGLAAYGDDHQHVRSAVVGTIVAHMLAAYVPWLAPATAAGAA
jgi:hypothetical protein